MSAGGHYKLHRPDVVCAMEAVQSTALCTGIASGVVCAMEAVQSTAICIGLASGVVSLQVTLCG